jgi:hypothetical protein
VRLEVNGALSAKHMTARQYFRVILLVSFAVGSLVFPLSAFAQGCALCYTQAASSGARLIAALRDGILILIVPPMFMSIGITLLAYRKRNHFNVSEKQLPPDSTVRRVVGKSEVSAE